VNLYQARNSANVLIIATEWSEFRAPDFERLENGIKAKIICDGLNLFVVQTLISRGYVYESIGR
jgi:UDPglucose 6-dehydrogenase